MGVVVGGGDWVELHKIRKGVTTMKWPDYKGHKVFCDCNASFLTDVCKKRLTPTVEYDYPEYSGIIGFCRHCLVHE